MKIYIVEDDRVLRTELMKLLNSYGYECAYSDDWQNIIQLALQESPDLILLDINLPLFDGFHICREIRKQSDVPIIVVTSRSTDMDELMSMNLGADDFITKPYNTQILVARIAALLKRSTHVPVSEEIEYKGVIFRPSKGLISYGADSAELTKNEMKILSVLLKNAGKIVSRDELMDELWQSDEFVDDNTLTVNVNRLRKKLGFVEGAILVDVLRQTTKSMNDDIADYRRMNTEYQDYIETWIHEIKIPISCIDLICENNKGEMASGVKAELSRIDGYVEQALYYARSTNLEKDYMIREIKLDQLVKGTLKKYSRQLIAAKATPIFDNLSQTVYGDPKWLEFILGQLIANSIKYKKETLTLTFSTREEQDNVLLYVSDDGIGIPESELPRIFEKGFTGTNGRSYAKSTGIGLYLCRKLCNKMHLSISASSASGQGTTIQITFPKDSRLLLE